MPSNVGEWVKSSSLNCYKLSLESFVDDREKTEFGDALIGRIECSPKPTVVDFSDVKYINSQGVASLLKVRKRALDRKVDLALSGARDCVLGAFQITGMDKLFTMYDSMQDAEDHYRTP
jgi:anti-sigma B factor antagonist